MSETKSVELAIIGGGPAGMTAAIYAAQASIDTIILEKSITGGLVNSTHTVRNFPSFPSIHGMELTAKMREQVDLLGVTVDEVCEIGHLSLTGNKKIIETEDGVIEAKSLILATGREPIALKIPTECEQIHYCAICDGPPYKGKKALVVGGGNSAFDESLYLLSTGIQQVHLVEMLDHFAATHSIQDELFATNRASAQTSAKVVDVELNDSKLVAAKVEDLKTGHIETQEVDAVFVYIGQRANNQLFCDHVELSEQGYILAGQDMSTNIPGVFGAGDINEKACRQITTALNDGTIAALSVEKFLRKR